MSDLSTLPAYEAKNFMRWVAEATERYFENPEVKRRFEEWKKEQAKKEKIHMEQGA